MSRLAQTSYVAGQCPGQGWVPGPTNACWEAIFVGLNYAHPSATSTNGWPSGTYAIDGVTGLNWVGIGDANDDLAQFNITQPVNKYDGKLSGVELSLQHFFEGTPYGMQANVTMLDTDTVDPYLVGEQRALPGFGDGANFSVFYEDEKDTKDCLITTELKVMQVKISLIHYSLKLEDKLILMHRMLSMITQLYLSKLLT